MHCGVCVCAHDVLVVYGICMLHAVCCMCVCAACVLYVVSRRGQSGQMAPLFREWPCESSRGRLRWESSPPSSPSSCSSCLSCAHLPTGRSGQPHQDLSVEPGPFRGPQGPSSVVRPVNLSAASLTPADLTHASSFAEGSDAQNEVLNKWARSTPASGWSHL